jgi:hypothetical protein
MKRLLLIVFLIPPYIFAFSQHCTNYFLDNRKTVQFNNYNKRGDRDGFVVYKVSNVVIKGNTVTSQVNAQLFDKNKKQLSNSNNIIKCTGNVLMVDMKLFMPQQQIEQYGSSESILKNTFLEYPAPIKTGDHLKDGSFEMEVDKNGLKQILQMDITDRIVYGTETIVTSAGKWECFIIKYVLKLTLQTGPIAIPLSMQITEWYAPSFGTIKTANGTSSTVISNGK